MSVNLHQTTLRNIPEHGTLPSHLRKKRGSIIILLPDLQPNDLPAFVCTSLKACAAACYRRNTEETLRVEMARSKRIITEVKFKIEAILTIHSTIAVLLTGTRMAGQLLLISNFYEIPPTTQSDIRIYK
jgi:hypothetical protein